MVSYRFLMTYLASVTHLLVSVNILGIWPTASCLTSAHFKSLKVLKLTNL